MNNFPSVQSFQKVCFCVLIKYFLVKQYCIFIYFFKKRCQRLKVKGQVERWGEKGIKLKVMAEDGDDGMHGI